MSARLGGQVSDGVQPLEGRNSARVFNEHRDLLRPELRGEVFGIDAVPGLWRTGESLLAPAMSRAGGGVASRR